LDWFKGLEDKDEALKEARKLMEDDDEEEQKPEKPRVEKEESSEEEEDDSPKRPKNKSKSKTKVKKSDSSEEEEEDDSRSSESESPSKPKPNSKSKNKLTSRKSELDLAALNQDQALAILDQREVETVRLKKRYYSDALSFISQIEDACPVVEELLGSKSKQEVLEAMEFFTICEAYKIEGAQVSDRIFDI
jgi:condensin complex subunit 1